MWFLLLFFLSYHSSASVYSTYLVIATYPVIVIYPASYQENRRSFYFARQAQSVKWSLINPEACKWA